MFIQVLDTPNPATLKFAPGRDIAGERSADLVSAEQAATVSPLALRLFNIPGVSRVFLGADFVAVTKDEDAQWPHLRAHVIDALADHLQSGAPILADAGEGAGAGDDAGSAAQYEGEAAEIVEQIIDLIDTRVRPAVAQDGGDIVFHDFDEATGVVRLHMRGACAGCPSSTMTLKQGIENLLKTYVPEVTAVEPVL